MVSATQTMTADSNDLWIFCLKNKVVFQSMLVAGKCDIIPKAIVAGKCDIIPKAFFQC